MSAVAAMPAAFRFGTCPRITTLPGGGHQIQVWGNREGIENQIPEDGWLLDIRDTAGNGPDRFGVKFFAGVRCASYPAIPLVTLTAGDLVVTSP